MPEPGTDRYHGTATIGIAVALMTIGVVMVLSAGASLDDSLLSLGRSVIPALRQIGFALVGVALMLGIGLVPWRMLRWRTGAEVQPVLLGLLIVGILLLMVYVPGIGVSRNGARRWINLGAWSFQPSELAKLSLIVFLAAWFSRWDINPGQLFRTVLPALLAVVLLVGLVGLEDFGTAALLVVITSAMLVAAGCRWLHLGLLALPGAALLAALLVGKSYRLERVMSFRDIWADPQGSGYHAVQSLCSIASGGWWGRGLGGGIQKYGYLPQGRSDFIFALICEELGIVGGLVVIGLLIGLIWQGRQAMLRCGDEFGRLLACGITVLIGTQAAINIAVVTVMVPTKGIALPFVSAGGSGMLVFCAGIGLLAGIARAPGRAGVPAEQDLAVGRLPRNCELELG